MLKSIKLVILGLIATSLSLSVIPPVNATVTTVKNEPVVTQEDEEIFTARHYRNYDRYNRRYRKDRRYRRPYRHYNWYHRDDNWYPRDWQERNYRRDSRYRRYIRDRRCFSSFQYDGYGDRYRVRICL